MTARNPRTMTAEREAQIRQFRARFQTDDLLKELDAERDVSRQLAECLESALAQLAPEYYRTDGYAECRVALAQYTATQPDTLASSGEVPTDTVPFQGGRD